MSYILHLHPDIQSFIFLFPGKKNEGAEPLMLLATKLDFPAEEPVQRELLGKKQKSTHKRVLMSPTRGKPPTIQTQHFKANFGTASLAEALSSPFLQK